MANAPVVFRNYNGSDGNAPIGEFLTHGPSDEGELLPYSIGKSERQPTTDRDVLKRFQSLGDNCEFGMVQRNSGLEPMNLLRFAGFRDDASRLIIRLTDALQRNFDGLGSLENIACELHGEQPHREYLIYETKWQLQYHTGCMENELPAESLRRTQVALLRFKCRELFADLRDAKSIFVWKSNVPTPTHAMLALVNELRRRGPNLLLWVKEADYTHPVGTVAVVGEGLIEGYVARFAPYASATDVDYASWNLMCRNASALADRLREQRAWSR